MSIDLEPHRQPSDLRDQIYREFVDRPFQFDKRHQLFIGAHNETLSVVAMRVNDPDCVPVQIHGGNTDPTPTALLRLSVMISQYFTLNTSSLYLGCHYFDVLV
jgi:hypothetical protein